MGLGHSVLERKSPRFSSFVSMGYVLMKQQRKIQGIKSSKSKYNETEWLDRHGAG